MPSSTRDLSLSDAAVGDRVRIVTVDLENETRAWLDAVGLCIGEEVVVLRRAALGGPTHLRTASGGEFAVAREVAMKIRITRSGGGT